MLAEGKARAICAGLLPTVASSAMTENRVGALVVTVTPLTAKALLAVLVRMNLPAETEDPGRALTDTERAVVVAPGKAATSRFISGEPHPVTRSKPGPAVKPGLALQSLLGQLLPIVMSCRPEVAL